MGFEHTTNTISRGELIDFMDDINHEFQKLDRIVKSNVDMIFSSSFEQHLTLATIISGNSVKLTDQSWSNNTGLQKKFSQFS